MQTIFDRPWYVGIPFRNITAVNYINCQSNDIWLKIIENLKLTEYFFKAHIQSLKHWFSMCFLVLSLYIEIQITYLDPGHF